MELIEDVSIVPMESSNFVKPLRMNFKQNGRRRIWDMVKSHDSVAIIIFNKDSKKLVFVKQFRPAVYFHNFEKNTKIDPSIHPPSEGITLELCAGIVDKDVDLIEIAKEEVFEECGYNVPLDKIEKIVSMKGDVGIGGTNQTLYYAEVTDKMKESKGGGLVEEGELIDVIEMSIEECKNYISQDKVISPGAFMFGILWFLTNKQQNYS